MFKLEQHVCFYNVHLHNKFGRKLNLINVLVWDLCLVKSKLFLKHVNCMFTRNNHNEIYARCY